MRKKQTPKRHWRRQMPVSCTPDVMRKATELPELRRTIAELEGELFRFYKRTRSAIICDLIEREYSRLTDEIGRRELQARMEALSR